MRPAEGTEGTIVVDEVVPVADLPTQEIQDEFLEEAKELAAERETFVESCPKPESMSDETYQVYVDGVNARPEGQTVADYCLNVAVTLNEWDKPEVKPEPPAPAVDRRPHYQCHKQVYAHKIAGLKRNNEDNSVMITPAEEGFSDIRVLAEFVDKHHPHVGDYLVYYEDGYISVSPAKAFEDGYELIEG